jgi:hypothetical protein
MSFRKTTSNPFVRWFAAVTLLAWIGAQALCQTHCLFGACHDGSDDASCQATAATTSHHGDDDHVPQPGHQHSAGDASCLILKSALTGNSTSPLVTPQFSILYTLAPFTLVMDATTIEPLALFSRQTRLREWVFTPEVCLGPAFRSHAPPFPSFA